MKKSVLLGMVIIMSSFLVACGGKTKVESYLYSEDGSTTAVIAKDIIDAYSENEMLYDEQYAAERVCVISEVKSVESGEVVLEGNWKFQYDKTGEALVKGDVVKVVGPICGGLIDVEISPEYYGKYDAAGIGDWAKVVQYLGENEVNEIQGENAVISVSYDKVSNMITFVGNGDVTDYTYDFSMVVDPTVGVVSNNVEFTILGKEINHSLSAYKDGTVKIEGRGHLSQYDARGGSNYRYKVSSSSLKDVYDMLAQQVGKWVFADLEACVLKEVGTNWVALGFERYESW